MNWWRPSLPASAWKDPWKWMTLSVSNRETPFALACILSSVASESPSVGQDCSGGRMFIKIKQCWSTAHGAEGAIYSAPWNSSLSSALRKGQTNFLGRGRGWGWGAVDKQVREDSQPFARHLSRSEFSPSFGLGSVLLLCSPGYSRGKRTAYSLEIGEWQKWETQTSGLLPQGYLYHSSFQLFHLRSKFCYLYPLKGTSTFKVWMILEILVYPQTLLEFYFIFKNILMVSRLLYDWARIHTTHTQFKWKAELIFFL